MAKTQQEPAPITINGKTLSEEEARTLCMALLSARDVWSIDMDGDSVPLRVQASARLHILRRIATLVAP